MLVEISLIEIYYKWKSIGYLVEGMFWKKRMYSNELRITLLSCLLETSSAKGKKCQWQVLRKNCLQNINLNISKATSPEHKHQK